MKTSSNHFDESSVNLLTRKEEEKDGKCQDFRRRLGPIVFVDGRVDVLVRRWT